MQENVRYVGLDVHKHVIEACFVDSEGSILQRKRFELTEESLREFRTEDLKDTDQVALEATTNSWAVVRILKEGLENVFVSNPVQTKAIGAAKLKSDKVDAEMLANLLRCNFLPLVWQPDERTEELRTITTRRATLIRSRTSVKNRIHSALHQRLIMVPRGIKDLFSKKGRKWLVEELPDLPAITRITIESDLRVLGVLDEEVACIDRELYRLGFLDDRVKLLVTMPGIDIVTAQTMLAALGDVTRFKSADKAASYFGLVPRTRSSANVVNYGRITKAGKSHSRWLMVQAAFASVSALGPLAGFYKKLRKRKNHGVAVVAVARKLVTYAWHMLTKGEPYRYANPVSVGPKLARLRLIGGGEKKARTKGVRTNRHTDGGEEVVPALSTVYESEGLPQRVGFDELPDGEQKMLRRKRLVRQTRALEKPQRRRVKSRKAV